MIEGREDQADILTVGTVVEEGGEVVASGWEFDAKGRIEALVSTEGMAGWTWAELRGVMRQAEDE